MPSLTPNDASILHAILAMGVLTIVMLGWMVVTRLPAMKRLGMTPADAAHAGDLAGRLPPEVRRVSDNYNHLFEQPTLFYAVALAVVLLGVADPLQVACAWAYVVIRTLHSLVQASVNFVPVRFVLFGLSWAVLSVMIVWALLAR